MILLPKKRIRPRTKQVERRIWMRHRRFVRSHGCCVTGCIAGPIEFAHLRLGTHTGMKQTPHDRFGISLCREHHKQAHFIGEVSFQSMHAIDWMKLAAEFTARSPDLAMRSAILGAPE